MKLVLCSEGFHTANTVQACVDLCGKPKDQISFAVINEAFAVEEGDKRWILYNLSCVVDNFPAQVDIINLLALSLDDVKSRIMQKDAIFVVGGNSDYLKHVFTKTGFDKLLPELLKSKVYVGSSAGSVVMGKRLAPKAYATLYGDRNDYETKEYLGLVDFTIVPHLDAPERRDRKGKLIVAAKDHRGLIYGLNDDAAVVVDGNKTYTIGSEPLVFGSK